MDLSNLTPDTANYMLRQGRATLTDAQAYCQLWNSTKVSTSAQALEKVERVHGGLVRVPRIVISDLN